MLPAIIFVVGPATGGMKKAAVQLAGELTGLGFTVHCLNLDRNGWPKFWSAPTARCIGPLGHLLRRHPGAIVHIHGLRAAWLVRWAMRRRQLPVVPLVNTLHSYPGHDPQGRKLSTHGWRLFEGLQPQPQKYVLVSHALGEWFRRRQPRLAQRALVIPHGRVQPANYFWSAAASRRRLGLPPGDKHKFIGTISRCSAEKGLDLLLAAFAQLQALPAVTAQWRLAVVGDGPQLKALRRQVQSLGLVNQVHFVGHVTEAARFMNAFNLCVVPSRSEGLGLTALEALAAGVPLVATRVGGLPELLHQGRCGTLAAPQTADLVQAMAHLIQRPDDARRRAQRGRTWVEQAYPAGACARAHRQLYMELMQHSSVAAPGERAGATP